jgi:cytochrome c-type biogenesis protein CcmE
MSRWLCHGSASRDTTVDRSGPRHARSRGEPREARIAAYTSGLRATYSFPTVPTSMLNQRRFILGAVVIAAAVSYLVWAGIRTTSQYYFEMDEFLPRRAQHEGEDLRVKGWVKSGSMKWDARTNRLAFDLARQDGSGPVPVAYNGILPDMFAEGREVVVEGHWANGSLAAKQIMTSCPSKYEPKKGGGAPAA